MKNIVGKKIELLPVTPKENELVCPTCGGVGWLEDDNGHSIVTCTNPLCFKGVIKCCPVCHEPYTQRYSETCYNEECRQAESIERAQRENKQEKERFDKAQKLKIEDAPDAVKEMIYSNNYDYNDGYCSDLDWLYDLNEDERPKYVWSTEKISLHIDADNIVSQACEDLHEDAFSNIDGFEELQEFLDAWCDKQTGAETYCVNYKLALLI